MQYINIQWTRINLEPFLYYKKFGKSEKWIHMNRISFYKWLAQYDCLSIKYETEEELEKDLAKLDKIAMVRNIEDDFNTPELLADEEFNYCSKCCINLDSWKCRCK